MTPTAYAVLMVATSTATVAADTRPSAPERTQIFAQLTIQRSTAIRIPVPAAPPPTAAPQKLKEGKGPKCIPMRSIRGAMPGGRESIDLFLRGGMRVRAKLDGCRSSEFYSGFYMKPSADGRICADRDIVHSRNGTQCEIERFRTLVPDTGK